MPRKNTGKRSARPLIPIDWNKVEIWIKAGCSGVEIAGMIGCTHETFYERYIQEYGSSFSTARSRIEPSGNGMIRTRQFHSAMQGNTRMLELLGKERLGQGRNNESLSPNDSGLSMIQDLIKQNKELQDQLNALISKADPVVPASNEEIQHLGGSGEERQDVCVDPQIDGFN